MAEFIMIMKGDSPEGDWDYYINKLLETGMFRGGSALGNGISLNKSGDNLSCTVTGFMRFEADDIEQIRGLLEGNPVYESGGEIEIMELIQT